MVGERRTVAHLAVASSRGCATTNHCLIRLASTWGGERPMAVSRAVASSHDCGKTDRYLIRLTWMMVAKYRTVAMWVATPIPGFSRR